MQRRSVRIRFWRLLGTVRAMIFRQTAGRMCAGAVAAWIVAGTTGPTTTQAASRGRVIIPPRDYLVSTQSYSERRSAIMVSQQQRFFSADVELNDAERKADNFLMALRNKETAPYVTNGLFPPA